MHSCFSYWSLHLLRVSHRFWPMCSIGTRHMYTTHGGHRTPKPYRQLAAECSAADIERRTTAGRVILFWVRPLLGGAAYARDLRNLFLCLPIRQAEKSNDGIR